MKNLAGNSGCDPHIVAELQAAGIDLVHHTSPLKQEVPASVTGRLTKNGKPVFEFTRAWYYWVVGGRVPLDVARELYANPIGATDVRVVGHCGCPPPEDWVTIIKGKRYVFGYHIDSQEGLNLFVTTLKERGLVD